MEKLNGINSLIPALLSNYYTLFR